MSAPRTIDEVKNDIRERVGHRAPFLHADKAESEQALARIADFSGETWAAAWNDLGAKWEERAKTAEKAGNAAEAKSAFLKSYGYYGIARHPFPSTPGKHHGYLKTREMFLAASKYFDIPVEKVSIPFQPKAIVGHLRLPKKLPAPMIMHWGGIDNWKEERHSFAESSSKRAGAVSSSTAGYRRMPDGRRTGRPSCIGRAGVFAQAARGRRQQIAVVGASFGGHWSTKLAHVAPEKLRAAVNWGGGIHYFFQPEWQERSRHADSYLFDLIEARANLFGKSNFDELCAVMPALSLKDSGLLDQPCAPLLIVNGKEDKQVPLEDFYLLLEHGTPKTIRLFPGGHMGAIPNILKTVVVAARNWINE
jgi:hypothetical protein